MTPEDIIRKARFTINDWGDDFRQSNEELVDLVMDGLRECSTLAPQLFYSTGDMQCTAGATEQGLAFSDTQAIADVIRVKGGGAILPCDMAALSAFRPNWGNDAAGPAVNWFRHAGDPLRFYIYPPAPVGQVIEIKYVRSPSVVGFKDEITDLPDSMQPALVNYVVAKAETKDDEHVNSGRAAAAYQQFVALLKPA